MGYLLQFDFSSHDGIYYILSIGKLTYNPKHQVLSVRTKIRENNNLNKNNKAKTTKINIYSCPFQNLEVTNTELSNKEYKSNRWTTTKRVSKTTILA